MPRKRSHNVRTIDYTRPTSRALIVHVPGGYVRIEVGPDPYLNPPDGTTRIYVHANHDRTVEGGAWTYEQSDRPTERGVNGFIVRTTPPAPLEG